MKTTGRPQDAPRAAGAGAGGSVQLGGPPASAATGLLNDYLSSGEGMEFRVYGLGFRVQGLGVLDLLGLVD